jgi:trimeric autotransporter adhesin
MKYFFLPILCFGTSLAAIGQNVGIGTQTPHASAQLDVSSTTRGLLAPRMTTTQRNAIASPAKGLLVYDTEVNGLFHYNGSAWVNLAAGGGGAGWGLTGNSGTNSANNFLGTTDMQPFNLRVNNRRFGYFDLNRNIFLGDSAGARNLPSGNRGIANIAIGSASLFKNLHGSEMIAIGDSALHNTFGKIEPGLPGGKGNLAVGYKSLYANTEGASNLGLGAYSLLNNTSGNYNTAIGGGSLRGNTIGDNNVAIGLVAMAGNISGRENTAVGRSALHETLNGNRNTVLGYSALFQGQGSDNIAIGAYASIYSLSANSTIAIGTGAMYINRRSLNIGIGDSALSQNGNGAVNPGDGERNTAVGYKSMFNNLTGFNNTSLGFQSLFNNTSGNRNVAVGNDAMRSSSTGSNNVAVGIEALTFNVDGTQNTAVGSIALQNNTTGDFNTAIGLSALSTNTGGNGNTGVGYNANVSSANLINATAIGYGAIVNASNKIRLGNNSVTVIEGQVAYTTSDGRFKKNINDNVPGLDFITALRPLTYQYRSFEMEQHVNQGNAERQKALKQKDFAEAESMVHMGFIAQDVEKLVKEKGYNLSLVHAPTNPTDNYSIAYGELVVPLVKAVQEQQKIIEGQQQRLDAQQKQIDDLKKMIGKYNK